MRNLSLAFLLASLLAVAGCGGSDNNGSSTKTTATAPASDTTPDATESATESATEDSSSSSGSGKFEVHEGEWFIKPANGTVKAGKVTIELKNDGKVPHELVIIKTDTKADAFKDEGGEVSEDGSVGEISDVQAVGEDEKEFDLKPGHYALICNINSHYKLGMHADLTVE